ncbi:MAG: hypothetical protein KGI87_11490, partial [Burkholderiales bacterium]|nr:hypothetical protein [Burkholderiales bacterium]
CGGGGSNTPSATATAAAVNPNAYPNVLPVAGDYFVYTSVNTPTQPAGQAPIQRTVTRDIRSVGVDRSFVRLDTASAYSLATTQSFDASRALTSSSTSTQRCDFTPGYRSTPALTSVVGDTYTTTSTESCVNQSTSALTTYALTDNGTVAAAEPHTLPIGTFNTIKYTQTLVSVQPSGTTTTLETCWIDTVTGRAVECASTYSTTPTGQSAPTSAGSTSFQLAAYAVNGGAAVGPTERRFAGTWSVTFSGSSGGACAALLVDTSGRISGTCQFVASTGTATPFTVSGSVNAAGIASVSTSTGAALTGTFDSPSTATGSWSNGTATGTWSAAHQ